MSNIEFRMSKEKVIRSCL